jgi:endonuclease G
LYHEFATVRHFSRIDCFCSFHYYQLITIRKDFVGLTDGLNEVRPTYETGDAGMSMAATGELLQEVRPKHNSSTEDNSLSSQAYKLWQDAKSYIFGPPADQAKPKEQSILPEMTISPEVRRSPIPASNRNLEMGNPSDATTDVSNKDNYLYVKDQYVMSYNSDHKTPNWVSWQLDSDWLGNTGRTGPFVADPNLPAQFGKATPQDYNHSGYDRGHNCPSGDRTRNHDDNEATFNMSDIAPQAPDNNRGPWEKLENYSRELANEGKELYIISGNEGSKGTIGNGVNVPETWFKVIVVLPQKGMGLADVTKDTEVIAIEMPNENGIKGDDWRKFETTIDEIEKHTGYHFLSNVPENVRKVLETKQYDQ